MIGRQWLGGGHAAGAATESAASGSTLRTAAAKASPAALSAIALAPTGTATTALRTLTTGSAARALLSARTTARAALSCASAGSAALSTSRTAAESTASGTAAAAEVGTRDSFAKAFLQFGFFESGVLVTVPIGCPFFEDFLHLGLGERAVFVGVDGAEKSRAHESSGAGTTAESAASAWTAAAGSSGRTTLTTTGPAAIRLTSAAARALTALPSLTAGRAATWSPWSAAESSALGHRNDVVEVSDKLFLTDLPGFVGIDFVKPGLGQRAHFIF